MGVINAREARVTDWTTRSVGAIWRAFDLQLVTYAILLTCFGLAMAYSNAVAGGDGALASGSVFLRGLLWTGIALKDGTLLVGGLRGTIYRSTDQGRSWREVPSGFPSPYGCRLMPVSAVPHCR